MSPWRWWLCSMRRQTPCPTRGAPWSGGEPRSWLRWTRLCRSMPSESWKSERTACRRIQQHAAPRMAATSANATTANRWKRREPILNCSSPAVRITVSLTRSEQGVRAGSAREPRPDPDPSARHRGQNVTCARTIGHKLQLVNPDGASAELTDRGRVRRTRRTVSKPDGEGSDQMKISARNVIAGTVKKIEWGAVNAEVVLGTGGRRRGCLDNHEKFRRGARPRTWETRLRGDQGLERHDRGGVARTVPRTRLMPRSRPEELYRQIAESLRAEILAARLQPGERLPSVRDLARIWGCTPGTAQNAFRVLQESGLIESHKGRGSHVTSGPVAPRIRAEQPLRRAALVHRAEAFLLEALTVAKSDR